MEPEVTTADGGTAPEATPEVGLQTEQSTGAEGTGAPGSELSKGEMLQADYTRKTQQLAEERRALEAERDANAQAVALMRALQADPQGTLQWLEEQVAEALGQDTQQGSEPEELDPVDARIAQVEAFIAQQQQAAVEQQIMGEISQLQQRFGPNSFTPDELLDHAVNIGVQNLEVALVHLLSTKTAAQRQQAEAQAQAAKAALPPLAGGSTAAGSTAAPKRSGAPSSLKEALNEALAENGLSSLPSIGP